VVTHNGEPVETERAHHLHLIQRHRSLRITAVVLAIRRLAAEAVATKIRRHDREPAREVWRDLVPDDVRLRKAVEQEQWRPRSRRPNVDSGASGCDLACLKSCQEIAGLGAAR